MYSQTYSVETIRQEFPALHQSVRGKPLAYLDNGATTQKPRSVIDAVNHFYQAENANIHRGIHYLSEKATEAYENVRRQIAQYINAQRDQEVVFVKGATEGINLVAHSYLEPMLQPGDEIIVTEMEHHANLVPWQLAAQRQGAKIKAIPVLDNGELDMTAARELFSARTRFLAVSHVSNVLGTINPVEELTRMAHQWDVPVLVDGAQAAPHLMMDMQAINCDFYVFSGHKMYGPTGIGVLYGRYRLLENMRPYQGGGNMIVKVGIESATFKEPPERFEPGTPPIASVMGLGKAFEFLQWASLDNIHQHESYLTAKAHEALHQIPGLRIYGNSGSKIGVVSFVIDDVHPHDLATVLDTEGVAVRAGHHCAMPLMDRFNQPAMLRACFACYNTEDEIDTLINALNKTVNMFRGQHEQ